MLQKQGGAPDWIRTSDLQLRRLPLYPAELRARRGGFYGGSRPPPIAATTWSARPNSPASLPGESLGEARPRRNAPPDTDNRRPIHQSRELFRAWQRSRQIALHRTFGARAKPRSRNYRDRSQDFGMLVPSRRRPPQHLADLPVYVRSTHDSAVELPSARQLPSVVKPPQLLPNQPPAEARLRGSARRDTCRHMIDQPRRIRLCVAALHSRSRPTQHIERR